MKTDCDPNCPSRIMMEKVFKFDIKKSEKFVEELSNLSARYKTLKKDGPENDSDYVKDQNEIVTRYGFPSWEKIVSQCLCGYFKEK